VVGSLRSVSHEGVFTPLLAGDAPGPGSDVVEEGVGLLKMVNLQPTWAKYGRVFAPTGARRVDTSMVPPFALSRDT